MKFIRGHNSHGMNRSKPWKNDRYRVEDRGYATPCWVWQLKMTREHSSRAKGGYGVLTVSGREWLAHRWYFEQANGPIAAGLQLDHLCEQRACVNPDHLEAVTPLENTRRSRAAKLSYDEACAIHRRRKAGETIRDLADAFDVSKETVRLIGLNGPDAPRLNRRAR